MAGLEVQIGADNSEFKKKIQEVEQDVAELSKIKLERIKLGLDTKEITANIKDAKKALLDLKTSTKDAGGSFAGMAPKVASGGNALMQFSRIAQDAPFGIMGIGNNITATVEAFGHLKNSTGSTGGALKALAGSIMGSGGILLAVSLVTSALTYMSQNNLSIGDVLDKLTGNFDSLKKAMTDVNNEAIKNAGAEIATMNALVSVAQDESNSREQRLAAVKELQKEYPAYFANLTKEQILSGDVSVAVRAISAALVDKAKAQILANKIGENDVKIAELQQKGQKQLADFTAGKGLFAVLKGVLGQQALTAATGSTANEIDKLRKETALYTSELEKSTKVANTFKQANDLAGAKKKVVKLLIETPKPVDVVVDMKTAGLVMPKKAVPIKDVGINIPHMFTDAELQIQKMQQLLLDLNEGAHNIIEGSISDTFANLGTVIGEALANGGNIMKAAGSALLSGIGGLLSDMGSLLIKMGTAAVLAGTVTKLFGTITGVGAGLAAIAGGLVLKGIGSGLSSKASAKGSGDNSVQGGNSVSSPQSSTSSSGGGGFSGGTVVFEISGQSLIGVLSNTLDKNRRLGGALAIG